METVATEPAYDAGWFVRFFEAVNESLWTTHRYADDQGRHCALGHLGCVSNALTGLGVLLRKLLPNIAGINDGYYHQDLPTPKQRVLAALRALIPAS